MHCLYIKLKNVTHLDYRGCFFRVWSQRSKEFWAWAEASVVPSGNYFLSDLKKYFLQLYLYFSITSH